MKPLVLQTRLTGLHECALILTTREIDELVIHKCALFLYQYPHTGPCTTTLIKQLRPQEATTRLQMCGTGDPQNYEDGWLCPLPLPLPRPLPLLLPLPWRLSIAPGKE